MKKMFLIIVFTLFVSQAWSQNSRMGNNVFQEDRNFRIPLIGESAPTFVAQSTVGEISFPADFGRKWKILLSHPADFTPVCTSEILELANLQDEFDKMGVKIVVVSTDPISSHLQWKKAMEELKYKDRDLAKIKFPLVEDEDLKISKKYGMIHSATNSTKAVRGVFIISPDNIVEAVYFYPMSVGRSTDELIRMVTALKVTTDSDVLTPVNWQAGNDFLMPFPPEKDPKNPEAVPSGYYSLTWFMWYKKAN